ncbi:peptidoglycan DD-metalloendopeptidase family protein [Saccharopolyspora gregorii]|uniref:peptidoglycan DD-metalloendopeptidase family protein n=1 Tax=Saccharopolyspora gregorii TaxID=33914 RepID=UPI0021ABF86B|nr:peptidoglycan DD-metalloendopeptidase family protein [Saccharopolyspora gregorii]
MVRLAAGTAAAFLLLLVTLIAAVTSTVAALTASGGNGSAPSQAALADIPADYLTLYQRAAPLCPGLDWAVLAAIGKVETDHGRLDAPGVRDGENFAGAGGPMQFLAPTFDSVVTEHPLPPGGATPPSRYHPHDAIHAAAFYLCDSGARHGDFRSAIFAYNHADWYVSKVLAQAEDYRATASTPATSPNGWVVPVQGRCTSGFGPREGDIHRGQDLAAPIGTPILAAHDGTIINAGPASGYGLWVRIEHADGTITTYGHNHRNHVTAGQVVRAGQPIAEVGNRGESTGAHLHFQIEEGGHPVDPIGFYNEHGVRLCP